MTDFSKSLEEKAENIIRDFDPDKWDNSIPEVLKREIAFTFDQMKRLRESNKNQIARLDKTACDISTEILQMEDRTPKYSPSRYPEREKFQNQLISIKNEKKKQELFYEDKLQTLQRGLLTWLQQYEQIGNLNGKHRQDLAKT